MNTSTGYKHYPTIFFFWKLATTLGNLTKLQHTNSTTKAVHIKFLDFLISIYLFSFIHVYWSILSVCYYIYVKKFDIENLPTIRKYIFWSFKYHYFSQRDGRKEDMARVAYAHPPLSQI